MNYRHGHWIGHKASKAWQAWKEMIRRCENPERKNYQWYGAKGIRVCTEWHSFENFLRDIGEPPAKEYSIDRKDSRIGYEPSNCHWAMMKEQQNNRTNNLLFTFRGETKTLSQWAEKLGIPYGCLYRRLMKAAKLPSIEEAFTKPRKGKDKGKDGYKFYYPRAAHSKA